MPDYGASELAIGAGSTLAVSTFLFLMLQAIKDFAPRLAGRWALGVLYGLSLIIAGALTAQTTPSWWDYTTYLSIAVITVSVSVVAKGIYTQLFHVAAPGIPPSPDAVATDVVDPQADEPPVKPARKRDKRGRFVATKRRRKADG